MAKSKNICICFLLFLISLCANGQSTVRQNVVDSALSQVGVREATGNNDGKEVEKYLKTVGLGKGYAWCAAFISWDYKVNNVTDYRTAWAPNWFPASRVIYENGKYKNNAIPQPGDLIGLYINNRIGHIGIVYEWGLKVTKTIEGNTNEAGSREGDGVYVKRRLTKQIYKASKWIN